LILVSLQNYCRNQQIHQLVLINYLKFVVKEMRNLNVNRKKSAAVKPIKLGKKCSTVQCKNLNQKKNALMYEMYDLLLKRDSNEIDRAIHTLKLIPHN